MDKFLSLFDNELVKTTDFNNYKIDYNEEQLEFIHYPLQDCKLLGIPGGGKTQSIIGKILHHYSKNDITKNNQFLILTFSRRACNDFIEKGKKQNRILFNSRNIRTIHSLSGKIVYRILDKKSTSQDTVIISSIDLIENNQKSILEMDEFSNLKVIFIDEAQDISYIQYQFILKISALTNCVVILIGDPNQNIYQFQNGSDKYLLNHQGKTFTLIKNYRSTPHIVNFINQFRPWDSITQNMISTKNETDILNKKPSIIIDSIDKIIENIIQKIMKSPFPKEEIAIIGPVKKSKPYNDTYTNIGLSLFTNLLNKFNINFVKHYEDTTNDEDVVNEYKKVKDHINLITIHGSKGLEFQQVFLVNFHTNTFGISPTEEKYKEFKYLWYVGLSRASFDLNIYIDKNKLPWNELKKCETKYYENENLKPKFVRELKFQEEILPVYNSVTEILGSKKFLDDQLLFDLENIFKYEVETIQIFDVPINKIKNYREYSALYGMFIENIFSYYIGIPDFITKLKKIIYNTIIIPKEYNQGYKMLRLRCPFIKDLICLSDLAEFKNQFRKCEEDVYEYLCDTLENNKEFYIECENYVINYSKKDLLNSIKILENGVLDPIKHIFNITIYYYQKNTETSYLWNVDFKEELNDLMPYINSIIKYAEEVKNSGETFTLHKSIRHPKLPLVGEIDLYNDNKIIDIKFSNNLNVKHILQVLLYQHLINPNFKDDYSLELWNFYLGNKYIIKLDKNINIFKLLKILSSALKKKLQNMIFIYDLKTTGSYYSNKRIDIIERHFEELTTNCVISSGLLKPVNVPFIPFEVTRNTGITKEMVYELGDSYEKFKNEMNEILSICNMPIFISHDGNRNNHKILLNKKIFTYYNCKLLDSKTIIRLFLDDDVVDKNLSDIFQYLFKCIPVESRALSDVRMVMGIFQVLNIKDDKLLNII